jgi:hypothetical protein
MNIRCLLLGCRWGAGYTWYSLGERLETCTCSRCGALKTVTA